MHPIRLLVSDIDGTLVRHDKSLPEANAAAIRAAGARGLKVSLISARPAAGILPIAKQLGLQGPFGAFNGGTIFDASGAVECSRQVPAGLARDLVELYGGLGLTIWFTAENRWLTSDPANHHTAREVLSAGLQPEPVTSFAPFYGACDKIVAVCDDPAVMDQVEAKARDIVGAAATLVRSQDYYLDCTALAANKGDGVAALAQMFGVSLEEVAVIGDQANDIAMFRRAGLSIAMGQANAAVQAEADCVTTSNEDAGVAAAIERFILPRLA